ncbi:MAG: 3-dehydroquinate synthase [Succinivibrionaceae bacterium]
MELVQVDLGERSYPIIIDQGNLAHRDVFKKIIRTKTVMIVTNTTVGPLYLQSLCAVLQKEFTVYSCILPDGEKYKTLETFNQILTAMLEKNLGRDCTVVALGGGVVGDISGFAASAYQRGVDFVQIPTTLLSQVDSSVGGKTGVNHPLGKNMIGAFYQPQGVIIDLCCLKTLPERELSAGMAEVIKYGIIWDGDFFAFLEKNMEKLMAGDMELLGQTIKKCCSIKAEVVHEDEREGGVRALLNLGHTFGHAIENFMGYGVRLHGEAVAAGCVIAARLAENMGLISGENVQRITALFAAARLPVDPPEGMTCEDFLQLMVHDKKVKNGRIRYVIPTSIGTAEVFSDIDNNKIAEVLKK